MNHKLLLKMTRKVCDNKIQDWEKCITNLFLIQAIYLRHIFLSKPWDRSGIIWAGLS